MNTFVLLAESGSSAGIAYDCGSLDVINPVEVLAANIQSRVADTAADRHMSSSRSMGLREMMRCATTAAARAVSGLESRIISSMEARNSAAGGLDPRSGTMSDARNSNSIVGLDGRSMSGLDARALDTRMGGPSMDGRSTSSLDIRGPESAADREEIVISTLTWPPESQDIVSQGELDWFDCNYAVKFFIQNSVYVKTVLKKIISCFLLTMITILFTLVFCCLTL